MTGVLPPPAPAGPCRDTAPLDGVALPVTKSRPAEAATGPKVPARQRVNPRSADQRVDKPRPRLIVSVSDLRGDASTVSELILTVFHRGATR